MSLCSGCAKRWILLYFQVPSPKPWIRKIRHAILLLESNNGRVLARSLFLLTTTGTIACAFAGNFCSKCCPDIFCDLAWSRKWIRLRLVFDLKPTSNCLWYWRRTVKEFKDECLCLRDRESESCYDENWLGRVLFKASGKSGYTPPDAEDAVRKRGSFKICCSLLIGDSNVDMHAGLTTLKLVATSYATTHLTFFQCRLYWRTQIAYFFIAFDFRGTRLSCRCIPTDRF